MKDGSIIDREEQVGGERIKSRGRNARWNSRMGPCHRRPIRRMLQEGGGTEPSGKRLELELLRLLPRVLGVSEVTVRSSLEVLGLLEVEVSD
jgi:hypothetical protein